MLPHLKRKVVREDPQRTVCGYTCNAYTTPHMSPSYLWRFWPKQPDKNLMQFKFVLVNFMRRSSRNMLHVLEYWYPEISALAVGRGTMGIRRQTFAVFMPGMNAQLYLAGTMLICASIRSNPLT